MNTNTSKILVIDDNPANLDVLSELLCMQNFVVLFALNAQSGLQRALDGHPDIILLDIIMPEMDGFELCRQLKSHDSTQEIPIIFMTALSDTVNKVKGFELGAVDYITKPIRPEEVLARINTHLKLQRLQRELRQNNEALQTSNRQLQEALEREKHLNTLKTRFISIASHELRSPLAAIQMTMDTLKHYGSRMSEARKNVSYERMQRTINDMTAILNDVLLFSDVQTEHYEFNLEPTELVHLCTYIIEDVNVISERTHKIILTHSEDERLVLIDPKLIRHVLLNLLSNAIKYSAIGSTIYLDLDTSGHDVVFQVRDEGIGISQEDQRHLFNAFHRGANVGDVAGTGLGLSIVKRFVDLHDGTFGVQSQVNTGSTFTVTLPRKDVSSSL